MKKLDLRLQRNILIVLLVISIALPVSAFARNENFEALQPAAGVSPDHVIEIPLAEPIMANTINSDNVYVLDSNNVRTAISRKVSRDGKTIIVTPIKGYRSGESYTLYIRQAVKYASGKALESGLKLGFTIAKAVEKLPLLGSRDALAKLLEEYGQSRAIYRSGITVKGKGTLNTAEAAAPAAAAAQDDGTADQANAQKSASAASGDYSTTNIQVQGVDEADIVKTDGEYIYYVNKNRIIVAKAAPADKMQLQKVLDVENDELYPSEMYLDDKYLVIIGTSNNNIPVYRSSAKSIMPGKYPMYYNNTVKMLIYDRSDINNIKKVREIELEGSYLSSRKIGAKLYLVANKYINYYGILNEDAAENDTPSYRDTAVKDEFVNIDYGDIRYFPDSIEPNYMVVAGLDLDTPEKGVNVSTYLGSGENIYASQQNLYVAVSKYNRPEAKSGVIYDSAAPKVSFAPNPTDIETMVYRFAMDSGKLEYTGKGAVPGTILNQFSMDEDQEYFRIATTKGEVWRTDEYTSKNNLYVLDYEMKVTGKIEDIAPGEKIYSVRFMGDRAYMVTFKKVDPLFVIDLKDPKKPAILGALKIPGYSDYLQPYDENHIIGFGKDAVEVSHKDGKGNVTGSSAYYLGIKMAIFDVSDVKNPIELFKTGIGDRGTDSELLRNHKALLFSKEKNLLAFPVTVAEVRESNKFEDNGMPKYGSFAFQGAYVYNIDLKKGFELKGRITHLTDEEYLKAGGSWYSSDKNIERIIYIGDNLYTLSQGMIKANSMENLTEKGKLLLP